MTALTPEVTRSLAEAVRNGVPIETAATIAGVSRSTVAEWFAIAAGKQDTWHTGVPISDQQKQAISVLSEALTRAAAEREAEAIQRIRNYRNFKGDEDWRAESWWLEHSGFTRDRWRPAPRELQMSGTVQHLHELKQAEALDDDQLMAAYHALDPAALPPGPPPQDS